MIRSTLRHFATTEFRHPDLVDDAAAVFLDDLRAFYGSPLEITSDARTPEENAALPDSSPTSLHLLGRAFDLKWISDPEALWRFVDAVYITAGERPIELGLYDRATNKHVHLGLFPNGNHKSRLYIRGD